MEEATAAVRGRLPQLAKYEVLEEIGHGGMATVYRARDKRLGREVALKVIHPHLRDSREVVSRFSTEARAVAKLRHPNIVEVFDVSEPTEPEQYLVAELVRGTTLRKLIKERGAMPPEIAAAIGRELLGALAHASANGVVHRDIKPENVLIEHRAAPGAAASERVTPAASGDRIAVKLTDFGIAKLLDAQGVTSTGQVLGSPAHMAPEQIEGGEVDGRADVFGMGVLLYECMVGHLPFEGTNPAQVLRRVLDGQYPEALQERPVIGNRWSALLDRALAHAAADRFADAEAMRAALDGELERLGVAHPKYELEAWLDDAASYEKVHAGRMIETLCALGADARKTGDVLQGAADYNRALAHAPDDPQLLRIVARLSRDEARARFLRRAGAALLLMVGLGGVAYGVGKLLRVGTAEDIGPLTEAKSAAPPQASAPGQTTVGAATSAGPTDGRVRAQTPTATEAPAASSGAAGSVPQAPAGESTATAHALPSAPAAGPHVGAAASTTLPSSRAVERLLQLDVTPPMGVKVSIDGAPQLDAPSGTVLKIDGKAHSLVFSCPVCTPVPYEIPAGQKEEPVAVRVHVPIKPAILVIMGAPDKTYQIAEHPEHPVRAGSNSLSLSASHERITVREIESGASQAVTLEAGKSVQATFCWVGRGRARIPYKG
jgi:serine/threonine-protein kinase